MSQAETIANAVIERLTVPPMASLPANSVRRDPVEPARTDAMPVLVVEPGDEPAPVDDVIGRVHRRLTVSLTAIAAGASAASTVDAIATEAHARLMADVTLGGLAFDLSEQQTLRRRDELDQSVLAVTKLYSINYETNRETL